MKAEQPLCASLLAKIYEQIDRTVDLIGLLPPDRLSWKPQIRGAWPIDFLLGHLLECLAGFCAVLAAARPEPLAHFAALRNLPVNHACSPEEAMTRIASYRSYIEEGFQPLTDADLATTVPTVFVRAGESILTLLLGNMEHLINHKHQLFMYLKQMGEDVKTPDLYCFRGE
jgi:hypothetical protein